MLPLLFENRTFNISNLYFYHSGNRFEGNGILEWNSEKGGTLYSQIKARVPTLGKFKQSPQVYPKIKLHFLFNDYRWGIAESFISEFEIRNCISNSSFTKNLDTVLLFDRDHSRSYEAPSGLIFSSADKDAYFPEKVEYTSKIRDELVSQEISYDALTFEDDDIEVMGRKYHESYFKINWKLKTGKYDKKINNIDVHLLNCFAICMAQTFPLLGSEIYRRHSHFTKLSSFEKVKSLYFTSLIPEYPQVRRDAFGKILTQLLNDTPEGRIAKNVFYRLLAAFNTRHYDVIEFMIPTTLEVILRTVDNAPLVRPKKNNQWKFESSLKKFQENYFNNAERKAWKKIFNDAKDIFLELRHKTAHPSWLEDNSLQNISGQQNFSDLIFLCNFYGKMIMAINGVQNIKPDLQRKKIVQRKNVTSTKNS
jgi:hypothetical protein